MLFRYTYERPKPVCYSQGYDIIDVQSICETNGLCGRKNRNKSNTALVRRFALMLPV
ncbi:Hypothetical predicted protein [Pelobates cultripes]|uniref:Uncharacterized protein n=1 Tax=Pelobates cultripes TaxID=61616 RepID=A0AAD1TBV9_PELCU|nr:Hypothetical predicted protein [Pelobates cultripes]